MTAGLRRNRTGANGFSLFEMLVVLAVLGMVAGLLAGGLGLGTAALRTLARVPPDDVATAQRILRGRIERAVPGGLAGTDRVLAFTSPPLDRDAPGATRRFHLTHTRTGELALRDAAGGPAIPLLAEVRRIEIAYSAAPGGGWRRAWTARDIPRLIRVRVQRTSASAEPWPEMIVNLRAAG